MTLDPEAIVEVEEIEAEDAIDPFAENEKEVEDSDLLTILRKGDQNDIRYYRQKALTDFFFFARDVLGFKTSKVRVSYRDEKGRKRHKQERASGPEYGISPLGPHKQIVDALIDGGEWVHIEAPRGAYKSTVMLCFIAWRVVNNPNFRAYYAMNTHQQARKRVYKLAEMFSRNQIVKILFPELEIDKRLGGGLVALNRDDPTSIDNTMEGGGPGCDYTGSHFDLIVLDDIINEKTVQNSEQMERSRTFFSSIQDLLDPGSQMVCIGTRYHHADLWSELLSESIQNGGQWHCVILDCGMELYQKENKTWDIRGTPTFKHMDESYLRNKLRGKAKEGGHRVFSSQYLNLPMSADEQVFFRHHFKPARFERHWMTTMRWFVLTDTATTDKETGCYSVLALVGLDSMDHAYLAYAVVGRMKPGEVIQSFFAVHDWAEENGINIRFSVIESNAANNVYENGIEEEALRRRKRVRLEWVKRGSDQSKKQRILGLVARMEQGRFHVLDTVPRWFNDISGPRILWDPEGYTDDEGKKLPSGEIVDQFITFPGKWMDIPDALADIEAKQNDGTRLLRGMGTKDKPINFRERAGSMYAPNVLAPTQRPLAPQSRAAAIAAYGGRYGN